MVDFIKLLNLDNIPEELVRETILEHKYDNQQYITIENFQHKVNSGEIILLKDDPDDSDEIDQIIKEVNFESEQQDIYNYIINYLEKPE